MSTIYTDPPQSRNEAIVRATIDGTQYTAPPQSRMEDLLLELKEAIEQGGGGTTVVANPEGEATDDLEKLQVGSDIYEIPQDYENLDNKPQINNVELSGNKTPSDLGLQATLDGAQTVEGNPITVTDAEPMNAESVKVELEPKQDLHGYDAPWVGGSGKNKLNNTSWTTQTINGVTFTPQTDGTVLVNGVNDGTGDSVYWLTDLYNLFTPQEEQILSGLPSEFSGVSFGGSNINYSQTDVELHQGTSYSVALLVTNGASVNNVTINPMIRKSTESADFEPYSNICPISGYSEVNVERVGKNLCPYEKLNVETSGIFSVNAGDYTLSFKTVGTPKYSTSAIIVYDDVDNEICRIGVGGTSVGSVLSGNFTLTEKKSLKFVIANMNTGTGGYYIDNIQLELGNQATTYEPYQGDTYTVSLGGTKYGGVLDVTSGGYSDEWGYYTIDGDTVAVRGDSAPFVVDVPDGMVITATDATVEDMICDSVQVNSIQMIVFNNKYGIGVSKTSTYIYLRLPSECGSNASEVNTWLQSNPISIAYHKTPSSVSTTPTDIPLLENTNNISSDGTNITLKYQPNNVIGECKAYTDEQCAKVLPPLPTTDGTYHLSCEVTSGVPVITWTLDS